MIANKIGITVNAYYKWESNERDIPTNKLKQLSDILDVSVDYLLKYDDTKPSHNEFIANFEAFAERHMTENSMYIIDYLSKKWEGNFDAVISMAGAYASLPPEIRKDIAHLCLHNFKLGQDVCDKNLSPYIDIELYEHNLDILYKNAKHPKD